MKIGSIEIWKWGIIILLFLPLSYSYSQSNDFFKNELIEAITDNNFKKINEILYQRKSILWLFQQLESCSDLRLFNHLLKGKYLLKNDLPENKSDLFFLICKCGDESLFDDIWSKSKPKMDIHQQNQKGATLLLLAAQSGNFSLTKNIIRKGANLHHKDFKNQNILHYTANSRNYNRDLILFAIENRVNIDERNAHGLKPLYYAILKKNTKLVEILYRNQKEPFDQEKDILLIETASIFGDLKTLKKMKKMIGDEIFQNVLSGNINNTPFLISILNSGQKDVEVIKFLVENGANYYDVNSNGYGVLNFSIEKNDLVKYFIDNGVNINSKLKGNSTILQKVIDDLVVNYPTPDLYSDVEMIEAEKYFDKNLAFMKYLISKGGKTSSNRDGFSYFWFEAIKYGDVDLVKFILDNDLICINKLNQGKTALEIAKLNKNNQLINFLENYDGTKKL